MPTTAERPVRIEVVDWPRLAGGPCVYLKKDRWDDFSRRVTFRAWLVVGAEQCDLGLVKILQRGQRSTQLGPGVEPLGPDWISLGQSARYYEQLDRYGLRAAVCGALNDLTVYPQRRQDFADQELDRNLFRDPRAARLFWQAAEPVRDPAVAALFGQATMALALRAELDGFDGPHAVDWRFADGVQRVGVLVGPNSSGKTRLLELIGAVHCGRVVAGVDVPEIGLRNLRVPDDRRGGGVLAISFSAFDPFREVVHRAARAEFPLPYVHVGLRVGPGRLDLGMMFEGLRRALAAMKTSRRDVCAAALEEMGAVRDALPAGVDPWTDGEAFMAAVRQTSSGHQVALLTLASLVAHMEDGWLALLDEPENHLHPGLLSTLLGSIHDVLDALGGHAVLATHSPIPLQETPAHMVRIVRMEGRVPSVVPYPGECFGEDLTRILMQAFETDPRERNFRDRLRTVFEQGGRPAVLAMFPRGLGLGAEIALRALERGL